MSGAEQRGATDACEITVEPKAGYRLSVGLFLLNAANRVFVGQRADMSTPAWQMPQGGIDPGETVLQAGLRELHEEIGTDRAELLRESGVWRSYELPPELAQRHWRGRFRGQTQKWLALRFVGADSDIDVAVEHQEFSSWRWADPARLSRLIVPFKRPIYLSVVEEFRHLWA